MKQTFRKWIFFVAAFFFFVAAYEPMLEGQRLNMTFFILGIVFMTTGAAVVRKLRAQEKESK